MLLTDDKNAFSTPSVGVTGRRFEHFVIAKDTLSGPAPSLDVKRGERDTVAGRPYL